MREVKRVGLIDQVIKSEIGPERNGTHGRALLGNAPGKPVLSQGQPGWNEEGLAEGEATAETVQKLRNPG